MAHGAGQTVRQGADDVAGEAVGGRARGIVAAGHGARVRGARAPRRQEVEGVPNLFQLGEGREGERLLSDYETKQPGQPKRLVSFANLGHR